MKVRSVLLTDDRKLTGSSGIGTGNRSHGVTSSTGPVDSEAWIRFGAGTGYNSHGVTSSFKPVDKVLRVVVGRTGYNSQGVTSSTGPVPTKERLDTDELMGLVPELVDVWPSEEED